MLFSLDVRDTQVGLKLFRGEVADQVMPLLLMKRYAFDVELLAVARAFGFRRVARAADHLDYRFTGSGVRSVEVLRALVDTIAIVYRLRVLRYYARKRAVLGDVRRSADYRPLVSLVTRRGELPDRLDYAPLELVDRDGGDTADRLTAARVAAATSLRLSTVPPSRPPTGSRVRCRSSPDATSPPSWRRESRRRTGRSWSSPRPLCSSPAGRGIAVLPLPPRQRGLRLGLPRYRTGRAPRGPDRRARARARGIAPAGRSPERTRQARPLHAGHVRHGAAGAPGAAAPGPRGRLRAAARPRGSAPRRSGVAGPPPPSPPPSPSRSPLPVRERSGTTGRRAATLAGAMYAAQSRRRASQPGSVSDASPSRRQRPPGSSSRTRCTRRRFCASSRDTDASRRAAHPSRRHGRGRARSRSSVGPTACTRPWSR